MKKNIFTQIAATAVTFTTVAAATITIDASQSRAASLAIANSGFEVPVLGENVTTDQLNLFSPPGITDFLPGWTVYDPDGIVASFPAPDPATNDFPSLGVWNPPTFRFPQEAPEGKNVVYLYIPTYSPNLVSLGSGVVGISQTLSSTLTANTLYTLKVEVGTIGGGSTTVAVNLDGFPGYEVQLLAGGTVLATESALNPTDGTFETSVLSFKAPANHSNLGAPLEIRLIHKNATVGTDVEFDNVRLTATAVPEMTSVLGLLAFSSVGASFTRRKKQTV